jgi:hypothetical protein
MISYVKMKKDAICHKEFKRRKKKLTHHNILRDDVTLIPFFCENHRDNGYK